MAPECDREQLSSSIVRLGAAVDVYSVGVMLRDAALGTLHSEVVSLLKSFVFRFSHNDNDCLSMFDFFVIVV